MHVIAAKAVAFLEALQPSFKQYGRQIVENCRRFAATLQKRGFRIVTGGTDTHLFLVDLTDRGITGKEAEEALGECAITVNKNTIPRETRSPFITSGIRMGTPCVTTRGMKEKEMDLVANWIADVLEDVKNTSKKKMVLDQVQTLCKQFPFYETSL